MKRIGEFKHIGNPEQHASIEQENNIHAPLESDREKLPRCVRPLNSNISNVIPIYSGTARENMKYGQGGGTQYFIPRANDMKNNGQLEKLQLDEDGLKSELDRHISKQSSTGLNVEPTAEVEQLAENTMPSLDAHKAKDHLQQYKDESPNLSAEEVKQLEENTAPDDMIPIVASNKKILEEEHYNKPHLNQEYPDPGGDVMTTFPDGWKKDALHDGEIIYQLSANGETPSSYFCNSDTVNACRKLNGDIDFDALKKALQISDENGEKNNLTAYRVHAEP